MVKKTVKKAVTAVKQVIAPTPAPDPVVEAPVVDAHRLEQRATRSQGGSRSRRLGGKLVA